MVLDPTWMAKATSSFSACMALCRGHTSGFALTHDSSEAERTYSLWPSSRTTSQWAIPTVSATSASPRWAT
jgi:hypothetical protein